MRRIDFRQWLDSVSETGRGSPLGSIVRCAWLAIGCSNLKETNRVVRALRIFGFSARR
jgi:hypothetical protein